jgi:hypothetical protein
VRNQENQEDRRAERSSGGIDDPPENPDTIRLTVCDDSAVHDEGTVVVLEGVDSEGQVFWFAADRRAALQIIHDVQAGLDVSLKWSPGKSSVGAR